MALVGGIRDPLGTCSSFIENHILFAQEAKMRVPKTSELAYRPSLDGFLKNPSFKIAMSGLTDLHMPEIRVGVGRAGVI